MEKAPNFIETPKNNEKLEVDITKFHNEISELIAKRKKREMEGMYELLLIKDVEDLVEEDAKMWDKVNNPEKTNLITKDDFEDYERSVQSSKNISRKEFLALITQKITVIWLNKQTEEKKNKNDK